MEISGDNELLCSGSIERILYHFLEEDFHLLREVKIMKRVLRERKTHTQRSSPVEGYMHFPADQLFASANFNAAN